MTFKYFSHNYELKPATEAHVPLNNVEYSYGYGVYETLRFSKGTIYFLDDHIDRLFNSARVISIDHNFDKDSIMKNLVKLLEQNQAEACNIKILLLGGRDKDSANLYMFCSNPLFPDRKLYKTGVACVTENYERLWPGAKTLNMLPSYLAYKKAREAEAYECLLVNKEGFVTEGTRTNFFVIKDKTIISPMLEDILPGVTRDKVLKVAIENGYNVVEQNIKLSELKEYDGAFLTSTSAKIMPIKSINEFSYDAITPPLIELSEKFNNFLDSYKKNTQ